MTGEPECLNVNPVTGADLDRFSDPGGLCEECGGTGLAVGASRSPEPCACCEHWPVEAWSAREWESFHLDMDRLVAAWIEHRGVPVDALAARRAWLQSSTQGRSWSKQVSKGLDVGSRES